MRRLAMLVAVGVLGVIFSVGCAACDNCQNCRSCRDCRGELRCVLTNPGPGSAGAGAILIKSARYGRDDQWVDVTPQVRGLVNGDTIIFPRDLHATFNVDPVPGRMKYVDMTVIMDGRVVEMTVGDNLNITPLRLRAAGGGAASNGGATTRAATSKQ